MDVGSYWLRAAAGCLVLTALTAGCLPHGPLQDNLFSCFPRWESERCCSRDCGDSQPSGHCTDGGPNGPAAPGSNSAVMAPYSSYHPVPTRPVFTPWALEDTPQDSGTLVTWSKGMTRLPRRPMDGPYEPPPPSDTNIAREPTFSKPASSPPSSSDNNGVTRAAASGWHSAQ
ncbi:MAG TPA: hypothetical protein VGX76_16720 [Pirellulales bacterium]|nr:hypothetical protein [Pirellulales bacterium]